MNLRQKWQQLRARKTFAELALIVSSINIAFTAFTNFDDILGFAEAIRHLTDNWRAMIHGLINNILKAIQVEVSVDVAVFWFLFLSFVLLCSLSYSRKKIVKSDTFDTVTMVLTYSFFIILAYANKAVFQEIFAHSGILAPMLTTRPTVFILFIGGILSIGAAYVGRAQRLGAYVYQSSNTGLILALVTLPLAIDLILFVFFENGILFERLTSLIRLADHQDSGGNSSVLAIIFVALIPCIYLCPLFITNHAIMASRIILTNALVVGCLLANGLLLIYESLTANLL